MNRLVVFYGKVSDLCFFPDVHRKMRVIGAQKV